MKAIRILGLTVAVAVVVPLLSTLHASAQPIAGWHYSGDVTGAGDIDFHLSAAGDRVVSLRVTHIPCGTGWHDMFPWPPSPPADPMMIVDNYFEGTLDPLLTRVTGHFSSGGSANGTFLLDLGDCQSPELLWTATAAPAVGGIAELPELTGSSAPNHIPLAVVAAAALIALAAGGWHARRRRLR